MFLRWGRWSSGKEDQTGEPRLREARHRRHLYDDHDPGTVAANAPGRGVSYSAAVAAAARSRSARQSRALSKLIKTLVPTRASRGPMPITRILKKLASLKGVPA